MSFPCPGYWTCQRIEFQHHFDSHSIVNCSATLDARTATQAGTRVRLLTSSSTWTKQRPDNPNIATRTHCNTHVLVSAALSRCRLFLNQLLTCVVVSPVCSASCRFSRGDGYGFLVYHWRRMTRDFSLKQ